MYLVPDDIEFLAASRRIFSYRLQIFDDRIGIYFHDQKIGILEAVIDTSDPTIRTWMISVFETYLAGARTLSRTATVDLFPEDIVA